MDLNDILANIADQDRGKELKIANPWTGEPTGITFRVAGPDSETQHRARIEMMDELAEMARGDGTVSAADREAARLNCLAKCVLGMTIEEDGKPVALAQKNIVRVLRAGVWLQQQVDAFAGDRSAFRPGAE